MFLSTNDHNDFSTVAGGGTVGLWERAIAINLFAVGYPSLGIIGAVLTARPPTGSGYRPAGDDGKRLGGVGGTLRP